MSPGPSCPSCMGLDARIPEGKLAWLRCFGCGHEWRGSREELADADSAERADRRRGSRPMAHEMPEP